MSDYSGITASLEAGASAVHICSTCRWDTFCLEPPTMTKADIDAKVKESMKPLDADDDKKDSGIFGGLLTGLMYAGKDTQAKLCPVLAARLRDPILGKSLVDAIRTLMVETRED
jgi:hypothetical protein